MTKTRYGSAVLAFVAAALALTGSTRDDTETGIAAVTATGWASLGLAIVALGLSVWSIRADGIALREATIRGRVLRKFASRRLAAAVQELHDVLVRAVFAAFDNSFPGGDSTLRSQPSLALCTDEIVSRLEQWDLSEPFDPGPWTNVVPWGTTIGVEGLIRSHTDNAVSELRDSVLYVEVLSTDVVTAIEELIDDPFVGFLQHYDLLRDRRRAIEDWPSMPLMFLSRSIEFIEGTGSPDTYRRFCERLDAARQLLPTPSL